MNRLKVVKAILISFILILSYQLINLSYASDPGTTGANFLKIGIGPRAAGMGEAQVAICNDVTSVFWNPAGLVRTPSQEASFMYNLWFESISSQYFGYAYPHPTLGTFAGSINYLSMDKIQGYTAGDVKTEKVIAYDLLGVLSYARGLSSGIYGGINLKFIQQKLEEESSFAFGVDIGVMGSVGRWLKLKGMEGLTLGLNLQNLGTKVRFQKEEGSLPMNFKFGLGLRKEVFGDPLTIAIDGNLPNDNDFYGSVGIEYWVRDLIGLRFGYKSGQDLGNGLSFGGGIKVNIFQLDYALVHFGELGYTHRIGIVTRFGKEARAILIERAFKKGMDYYNEGKYPEAILEFNKVLELDPKNEKALEMMRRANEKLMPQSKEVAPAEPKPEPKPEPPKVEMPKEVKVREEERGLVVTVGSQVLFESGKAELKSVSGRVLDQVAKLLAAYPQNRVKIEGHADSVGRADYNQKISEMRAKSVAEYLIEKCDIPKSRIETIGYGETKPIASNKTVQGRTQNRRVEIVILKQPKLSSSHLNPSPLRGEHSSSNPSPLRGEGQGEGEAGKGEGEEERK
jgi:outer membrane protein OmpA-like peptidoglycan-associated protein